MNLKLDYPLERFMIWLTGGDHRIDVVIDEALKEAILGADPTELLCKVITLKSGCIVVQWADKPDDCSLKELQDMLNVAFEREEWSKVKQLRERMRQYEKSSV